MNSDAPRMAQFTAMSGRKMPSVACSVGTYRSSVISTICTLAAIVPM
jgi:hypothetical protein